MIVNKKKKHKNKKPPQLQSETAFTKHGAEYEARTRYLHLGKVALYQMS